MTATTTSAPSPRASSLSLVGVLAAALGAELLLDRLAARALQLEPLVPLGWVRTAIDVGGRFSFHLASVLAVLLVALAFIKLLVQPSVLPARPHRLTASLGKAAVVTAMVGFVAVAVLGVGVRLPQRLELYLLGLFAFLVAQLVRGALPLASMPARAKLWLVALALALGLHCAWVAASAFDLDGASRLPRLLLSLGEALAVTIGVIAPGCFPVGGGRRFVPALIGVCAGALAIGVAFVDGDWAARIAAYGFGLQLPGSAAGALLYAAALGGLTMAATALLLHRGPTRLRGWGLLCIGLSGYQLELPYQLAATLVGVLCLIDSYVREAESFLTEVGFRALLQRLAASVGAKEVTAAGPGGFEDARMHFLREGELVELALHRRAGALSGVEVAVGQAPADDSGEPPPLSLHRRGGPRLGKRAGLEVGTGDARFDAALDVHDARTLHARDPILGDDDLRARLGEAVDGWLGAWPGHGLRFRSVSPTLLRSLIDRAGGDSINRLIDLLLDVKRRSAN